MTRCGSCRRMTISAQSGDPLHPGIFHHGVKHLNLIFGLRKFRSSVWRASSRGFDKYATIERRHIPRFAFDVLQELFQAVPARSSLSPSCSHHSIDWQWSNALRIAAMEDLVDGYVMAPMLHPTANCGSRDAVTLPSTIGKLFSPRVEEFFADEFLVLQQHPQLLPP